MAALSIDKTTCSRLISAASKIPQPVIERIGPAPKAGRDRWIELATRLERKTALEAVESLLTSELFAAKSSDDRFAAAFAATAQRPAKTVRSVVLKAGDGTRLARINEDAAKLTLALDKKVTGDFAAYLIETLPDIYAAFRRREDQTSSEEKEQRKP